LWSNRNRCICVVITRVNGVGAHIVKLSRALLPRDKSAEGKMLLAPESEVRYDFDFKDREKLGERTHTLTKPDRPDSSPSYICHRGINVGVVRSST
jgi:hypothetical protein